MTMLNVSYEFKNIEDLGKDAILKSIIEPFGGDIVECGSGFGSRDLGFYFEDFDMAESCYNELAERYGKLDLNITDLRLICE